MIHISIWMEKIDSLRTNLTITWNTSGAILYEKFGWTFANTIFNDINIKYSIYRKFRHSEYYTWCISRSINKIQLWLVGQSVFVIVRYEVVHTWWLPLPTGVEWKAKGKKEIQPINDSQLNGFRWVPRELSFCQTCQRSNRCGPKRGDMRRQYNNLRIAELYELRFTIFVRPPKTEETMPTISRDIISYLQHTKYNQIIYS